MTFRRLSPLFLERKSGKKNFITLWNPEFIQAGATTTYLGRSKPLSFVLRLGAPQNPQIL
jgi:hypothetical protein